MPVPSTPVRPAPPRRGRGFRRALTVLALAGLTGCGLHASDAATVEQVADKHGYSAEAKAVDAKAKAESAKAESARARAAKSRAAKSQAKADLGAAIDRTARNTANRGMAKHGARALAGAKKATAAAAGTAGRTSWGLPDDSGSGRRVVYAKGQQRVWLVDADGTVDRTYLVSGLMSQPDPGRYRVFSKSRHATSAVSPPATMQYMVRFARGKETGAAIGFHDIPFTRSGHYEQTESQLGRPISAGCVRQKRSDAASLWSFAPVGIRVVVLA